MPDSPQARPCSVGAVSKAPQDAGNGLKLFTSTRVSPRVKKLFYQNGPRERTTKTGQREEYGQLVAYVRVTFNRNLKCKESQ